MKRASIYKIFTKMPVLETERLILRKMCVEDAGDMYEYSKNPEVTEYLTWSPHPDEVYTRTYLSYLSTRYCVGDFFDWAVTVKESGKMIGSCGFTRFDFTNDAAEVGYVLNPEYWGKGIAAEALFEVIKFGFSRLDIHRVEGKYIAGNEKSRRVMEKVGMRFEGVRRESMKIKGKYRDIGTCSLLREEFCFNRYNYS